MSIPSRLRAKLEEAGIINWTGNLDRPLSGGGYLVPAKVTLGGDIIRWKGVSLDVRTPSGPLLDELLALSTAQPKHIREFVERWGPLDLVNCIDVQYRPIASSAHQYAEYLLESSLPVEGERRSENCSVYVAFANYVQRHLNLAGEIYKTQDESYWRTRFPDHEEFCSAFDEAVYRVEACVDNLLALGGVTFGLDWQKNQWQVQVSVTNTVGAIGMKVMLAVARADSLYICYGCKNAYLRSAEIGPDGVTRRKRPRPDQRNYCGRCGRKKAVLDAKRRNRMKHHDARRLYEVDGRTPREISAQLLTTEERVRNWIQKGRWIRGNKGT